MLYGLRDKIIAMMLDYASNNDMLVQGIESRCHKEGIVFDAKLSRLRCMPHTVHLAAIKLLEAIGVISKKSAKKAAGQSSNYQDAATAHVDRSNDVEAALQDDPDDDEDESGDTDYSTGDLSDNVFYSVNKLRKIVRAVRSSPQHKQAWLRKVRMALESW
ncbi:hypothetical protein ARMSODRAFT_1023610 [Armillaria solidipes]|uniref:hAT-like transposase RNase-H fold domain-containing protein n=1 Tax=Armillaria solidipes TaxID=1076256 RepID=A0A2H3BD71_9AGAR|nr:hypothetical protein ARMSODRAFT_1023610 [Armillaria solidipes]